MAAEEEDAAAAGAEAADRQEAEATAGKAGRLTEIIRTSDSMSRGKETPDKFVRGAGTVIGQRVNSMSANCRFRISGDIRTPGRGDARARREAMFIEEVHARYNPLRGVKREREKCFLPE